MATATPPQTMNPTRSTTSASGWGFHLLDNYLWQQIGDFLSLALTVFTLLVFFSDTFLDFIRDMQRYGIPLNTALLLTGLQLPKTIALVIPPSVFLAVLLIYTSLSAQHELIAMRMAGIPLGRLMQPALLLGLLATVVCYTLGDWVVPACNRLAEALRQDVIDHGVLPASNQSIVLKDSAEDGTLRKVIYVSHSDGKHLGPSTVVDRSDANVIQVIQSRGGQWFPTHWSLTDANVYTLFRNSNSFSFHNSQVLNVRDLLGGDDKKTTADSNVPNPLEVDSDLLPFGELYHRVQLRTKAGLETKKGTYANLWEKLTLPLSCLALVLVAIPLAMVPPRRQADRSMIAALVVLCGYYILRAVCIALGRAGWLSFGNLLPDATAMMIAAWLPVIVVAILGLLLVQRKQRIL
ncbi:MAG: LptF/LptG family permease [Vampirovibrionales bacterium]|nr:LptF/LptG family permease [Vampirovibrionales bacterium]